MIKNVLLILILMLISGVVFAEDDSSSNNEWGENSSVFDTGFENQKPVSDKKMHEVIDKLKERNLSRKQRRIRKEVQPLSPSSDFEHLKEFTQSQSPDDALTQTHTVMIPMRAYSEDGIYMYSVEAKETKQDLEQDTITFCNAEIIDNGRIRLMFGSIDLNLVGYIYFK